MNSETGFLHKVRAPVGACVEDPRGARHGAYFRTADLYSVGSFDPDHDAVMRIGGETPGGGPILSVGIKRQVRIRFPATSDRQFGSRAESERECRKWCSFQDAGRKTTPSSGSPVVTRRQSAMTSLRASATIMVFRVPLRLSAVRARYHNASALSF